MKQVDNQHDKTFESLRHHTGEGIEFWSARELLPILEYSSWDKFKAVIRKAVQACENSGIPPQDHFSQVGKMVKIGSGAERYIKDYDYHLSRYACYLIVQNADSSKPIIASGQTYFAIQTRRQELEDDEAFKRLEEDEKRLFLRNELTEHNKQLMAVASDAGVASGLDFAIFQNHGYQGLYGGLDAKDIHQKKGLKKSQKILDHMGSTELAANLFRATQTEEKLRREAIKDKAAANTAHHQVGAKVRETIREIGGIMPEALPTPETSVQSIKNRTKQKNLERKKKD